MATTRCVRVFQSATFVRGLCTRSAADVVVVEDKGPVRIVSINRPEARNAVNSHTAQKLYNAFQEFERDQSALVGILAGKGASFCAGYDLKDLSNAENSDSLSLKDFSINSIGPMGPSRLLLSKPVIGCLTGYVVAGGLELAAWCDLRIAEESVKMGVLNRRYGVPLLDGGTVRLQQLVGLSHALDLILTGREIHTDEALRMGLINRVVEDGEGLEECVKLANQIARFPQACLKKDRMSTVHAAYGGTMEKSLNYEFVNGTEEIVIQQAIANSRKFSKKKD